FGADLCEHRNGHLCAGGRCYQHALEGIEVIPEIARVAHVDRIAFAPFDGHRDGLAANGTLNDVVYVLDTKAVSGCSFAVHGKVEEISARRAFGKDAARVRKITQSIFDLHRNSFDLLQVGAEDLNPEDSAKARGKHLRARLDRHPENVGHAGRLDRFVHFGEELFPRHAGPPFLEWLKHDHCFKHRKWSGIGWCLRLASFAEDTLNFRKLAQDAVLDLQDFGGLRDGHARHSGRHEEQRAFVERRHELLAETTERIIRRHQDEQRRTECEPAEPQHEIYERPVGPDQETVDWIFDLRGYFAADEPDHEHRHKAHSQ